MRIPRPTAEYGIGPASAHYRPGHPGAAPGGLAPMAVGDTGFGDFTEAMAACQPPNVLCAGEPGTPGAGYWRCCEPGRTCATDPASGQPVCGPRMPGVGDL